ncbi:MAG TPA: MFS transporter [Gemmatimonadaceae bacterium]|nr:MFS transporter [Gemmatimonadaceae bacterium]
MPDAAAHETRGGLPTLVRALALVSLLTDAASEMIYPLLPVFMTTVLGASPATLGLLEGAAESTAALLKLGSGWLSDRIGRYTPVVLIGYALATITRPFIGAAQSVSQVIALRLVDRVGKGIRGAPRDALLAGSVPPSQRGRAFGFHRAADHLGAVIGPIIAWMLLQQAHLPLRAVFMLSALPGALAVLVIVIAVRDPKRAAPAVTTAEVTPVTPSGQPALAPMPTRFWAVLGVLLLFTLGNSTDAFLLLRAQQLGVPIAMLPLLWAAHHVVKSASSVPGGALSDRIGRRRMMLAGWGWYALVYAGFALATNAMHAWALFLAYGLFFGMVEGAEKALIADLAPADRRGTAFGWYNAAMGVAALPASLLLGAVWTLRGPSVAFGVGASIALLALVLGIVVLPAKRVA